MTASGICGRYKDTFNQEIVLRTKYKKIPGTIFQNLREYQKCSTKINITITVWTTQQPLPVPRLVPNPEFLIHAIALFQFY